ncbi:TolB family protein, partial [Planctomycetota bacterium]
ARSLNINNGTKGDLLMGEDNGTELKNSKLVPILLVLSAIVVALSVFDAVASYQASARNSAPRFLFLFILPGLLKEEGRFVTLAAQLALPGLAVFLPFLSIVMPLKLRKTRAVSMLAPVVGVALLVIGLGSGAVLYKALGAVPQDDNIPVPAAVMNAVTPPPDTSGDVKKNPAEKQPEAVPAPEKKGVEKIVFASDRDEKWHLYIMNPDGSGQEKISTTNRAHMQPRFSPDGARIVFTSGADKKFVVVIFDRRTGEEKDVCEGSQASFADGGRAIVFRRGGQVYHRNIETGQESMLSPKMWSKCSFPSGSADGKHVAFASRLLAGYNIYIVPVSGGEPKTLVGGQGACDPRWSPTGTRLSYQTETNIYTIKPDGTGKFQATFGGGVQHYATWSPDEKTMAYCQGPGPNGPWQIYSVSLVEDEDPVKLTKEGSNIYPDWGVIVRER